MRSQTYIGISKQNAAQDRSSKQEIRLWQMKMQGGARASADGLRPCLSLVARVFSFNFAVAAAALSIQEFRSKR